MLIKRTNYSKTKKSPIVNCFAAWHSMVYIQYEL